MFGFVLAIGIVVDDAIIVVEAIQHYIDEKGMSPKEATYHAMKDISAPVVAIALILAAVFVPVGFIPGIVGRLYQQFAITIAISVILSAFTALSLTPALCSLLPAPIAHWSKNVISWPGSLWPSTSFQWVPKSGMTVRKYGNGVGRCIKGAKYIVIILVICIIIGAVLLFKNKPSSFIPSEDDSGRLYVTYQLPEASSTAQSVATMEKLMTIVGTTPGVNHYSALSGLNILNWRQQFQ